jgi:formylglycine-generating enzyme required for sulfatase activity
MSKYDITRAEFTAVTGLPDPSDAGVSTGTGDPVQMVNWYQAIYFCNVLSIIEGLMPVYVINGSSNPANWGPIPTAFDSTNISFWLAVSVNSSANGYSLPTSMEWMWAAMGATSDPGYTGGIDTTGYAKAFAGASGSNNIDNYAWTTDNAGGTTHPVGTKMPNELGLCDMSGNVWQWCWDWSGNPDADVPRVVHGGSWDSLDSFAVLDYPGSMDPFTGLVSIGFRVVRP